MEINAQNAPKPLGLYPHARRVGNLLFLSGVGPRIAGSDAIDSVVPGLTLDNKGNYDGEQVRGGEVLFANHEV